MPQKGMSDDMAVCGCSVLGRASAERYLFEHHPECEHYDDIEEAITMIERLVDGMTRWSQDEDGIHPDAWDAYEEACIRLGRQVNQNRA